MAKGVFLSAGSLGALGLGVLFGFFIVFNAIFSDVFSWRDRLLTFIMVIGVYGITGILYGYFAPIRSWQWGLWLGAPAVLFVVLYSLLELERIGLHFTYILLTLAGGCGGAYLGSNFRQKNRQKTA